MSAPATFIKVVAKAALLAALSAMVVSAAMDQASAARRRSIPPGACLVSHRHVVANSATCMTSCNTLGWCTNMVCNNGKLTQLPLPCHSPEACPALRC